MQFRYAFALTWIAGLAPTGCAQSHAREEADTSSLDAARSDAARDARTAPDVGVCTRVLADPMAFTDEEIWACARAGQLGRCNIGGSCPGCACEFYATNTSWDCPEACPTELRPTGCLDLEIPGFGCPVTSYVIYGACIMRREILAGHCAPCACP